MSRRHLITPLGVVVDSDWRGYDNKAAQQAQHRVVLKAMEDGTLDERSPYYGWSIIYYRKHFQLDTAHPLGDEITHTIVDPRLIGDSWPTRNY